MTSEPKEIHDLAYKLNRLSRRLSDAGDQAGSDIAYAASCQAIKMKAKLDSLEEQLESARKPGPATEAYVRALRYVRSQPPGLVVLPEIEMLFLAEYPINEMSRPKTAEEDEDRAA